MVPTLGGREGLHVIEDVQVHVVLHVVERILDRDGLCQVVGKDGVVAIIVDALEFVGIDQPGKHRRTDGPKDVNLLCGHNFFM